MSEFTVLDLLDLDLKEHNQLQLKCIAGRSGLSRKIVNDKISRPGLALSGFFQDFASESIQLFGRGEQAYLQMLESKGEWANVEKLFTLGLPCVIFIGGETPSEFIMELCEKNAVALLVTPLESVVFQRRIYALLDEVFAETMTIHGVLMEVYGIGILIRGDSGIGKSEVALELIERGHRLISDDTVKIKRISDSLLIGMGENPMLAHHMEIRGIGIINLQTLFGVGAIREKKQIQLSVKLEQWHEGNNYDRIGDQNTTTIMGIELPEVILPVSAARNIPILIETAARNERLKKLGYYSSKEFDQSVLKWIESETAKRLYYNTDTIGDDL